MKVDGLHHVTAITADIDTNLAFYGQLLGLRLVLSTIIEIPHLRSRFFPRLVERGAELLKASAVSAHAVALAVDL